MSKPNDVLDDLFAGIEGTPTTTSTSTTSANPQSTTNTTSTSKSEKDILAELDLLTADRPTTSRPTTPRGTIRKSLESRRPNIAGSDLPSRRSGEGYGINTNISRPDSADVNAKLQTPVDTAPPTFAVTSPAGISTPPPSHTPARTTVPQQATTAGGGGWWGSIFSTASSAITTAQHAVNTAQDRLAEIQKSEEAKKWTSQATSLLGSAQSEIRSRALPTLSNILQTIAPPIASHEQLRIHITHDIQNYPSIDTIVYGVFDRVMQQVEGGDLLVVQRGGEAKPRSSLGSGWAQGPWYKSPEPRALNALASSGVEEGVKLAKASAEGYALEFTSAHGDANEAINPSNPTRKSDIFLSIQPTIHPTPSYLITSAQPDDDNDEESENLITFALYLHDPNHNISYSTLSQSIPARWLEWIDAPAHALHPDIEGIIEEGGVDPREWVVEWVEETLGLAVGVVAQRYVARRMNVGGNGGVVVGSHGLDVKGKGREVGGGEEARAVGM